MLEGDFADILRAIHDAAVDFYLVGEMAGALNWVPVSTCALEILYSREPENVARLLPVLESLDAVFRIQRERRLKPNATHLTGTGHVNLITRYGPLDLLGSIGRDLDYQDLLPHSTEMNIGGGIRIRVLNLEKLIAIKEELAGEKDRAMLPLLRRTLSFAPHSGGEEEPVASLQAD